MSVLVHGFLVSLCVVLAVAFFTLVERKSLAAFQLRRGPEKVGYMGLTQPIADALKLSMKEWVLPYRANIWPFMFGPFVGFMIALLLWFLVPYEGSVVSVKWGAVWFICVSSLSVYGLIMCGWASNSKYSMLGTMRGVAQVVSYEVSMSLILFFPIVLGYSFDFSEVMSGQVWMWFGAVMFIVAVSWVITTLAETQRPPFDLAEGESELVSGYHVEYSGAGFAVIFLAEYVSLLFMGALVLMLFFGGVNEFSLMVGAVFMAWGSVWVRASFPRCRYDQLMMLTWKSLCPLGLGSIVLAMIVVVVKG